LSSNKSNLTLHEIAFGNWSFDACKLELFIYFKPNLTLYRVSICSIVIALLGVISSFFVLFVFYVFFNKFCKQGRFQLNRILFIRLLKTPTDRGLRNFPREW
jgi:uncharacterized membrane protein YwzB